MQRIQDLAARLVAALMAGHHLARDHDLDALGVGLHGRRLKGITLRHAVTHPIKPRRLILVDLRRLMDAGIEALPRQRQGPLPILCEAFPDGLTLFTLLLARGALPILQATLPQVGIEFGQILHPRHRRGPAPLQRLDPIFHVRLFIATGRHAEQRIEHVVAGQGLIARMHLPFAAAQDRRRHRLGIVPPHFPRHALKEVEPLHHPFQDRLGSLARQSHGERTVRVRPHQQQHRNLPPPFGKVDVDVAKVRFQTLARIV